MKLPWTKKPEPSHDAMMAVKKSYHDLDVVQRQLVEARKISSSIRESHDVNHYATALAAALGPRRPL